MKITITTKNPSDQMKQFFADLGVSKELLDDYQSVSVELTDSDFIKKDGFKGRPADNSADLIVDRLIK